MFSHKSHSVSTSLGLALCAVGGIGCGLDGESADTSTPQSIQGGQLETGFPAVGEITLASGAACTGALIAPDYVLTARHCHGAGMVFFTGNDLFSFVSHTVDKQVEHPTLDLLLAHLATPVPDIQVMRLNEGAPPAPGTVCTAVGFGIHTENGVKTSDIKRSATEQVDSSGGEEIDVHMVSGIADDGDSGGPLVCNERIAAAVQAHFDAPWPAHNVEVYTTIDRPWIAANIGDTYTELALQNGWLSDTTVLRKPGASFRAGVVHFKGAIFNGASGVAFTLPPAFRPSGTAFVNVDLCGATHGRLVIQPTGAVSVEAEPGQFAMAQCRTSLEGASYVPSPAGLTALSLQNGWVRASVDPATVENISGIVHFRGAIANGSSALAFTLPVGFRPSTDVYVPVDMCGTKGRLEISSGGSVSVRAETDFSRATCTTSLDGAWFVQAAGPAFQPSLQNGWTSAPFSTSSVAIQQIGGIAYLKGAIASGTTAFPFTLPASLRPASSILVPIDVCGAHKGHLYIQPSGTVMLEEPGGGFASSQCFASFDGASYAIADFAPLPLVDGWTQAVAVAPPSASLVQGIVRLRGGIASGSDTFMFTLPDGYRPSSDVYVPLTLCGAKNSELLIRPSGDAALRADFADATCLTSLDGISFPVSEGAFTTLSLLNGWAQAPASTRNAAAINLDGIIHLAGGIAGGTSSLAFILPSAFRPVADVHLPVDLCNGRKGSLLIQSSGQVSVTEGSALGAASCFTSLESVSFPRATSLLTPLVLQNGWAAAAGARPPVATNAQGIIHLAGAVAGGTQARLLILPVAFRPTTDVYAPLDLGNGAAGRLRIQPTGEVTVQASSAFSDAQLLTSLEGVSFAL